LKRNEDPTKENPSLKGTLVPEGDVDSTTAVPYHLKNGDGNVRVIIEYESKEFVVKTLSKFRYI
jgi:hypothetical protein